MKTINMYDSMLPAIRMANSLFGSDPFEAFDSLLASEPFRPAIGRSPAIDVREDEKSYTIEAELPGLSEKDVKLELKDGVLSLSAERKEDKEDKDDGKWIRRERRDFSFSRSFRLSDDVDAEKIEASFKDGLLTVLLPKRPETAPRLVPVKAA